jgi:L-fuconolactonase
MTIINSIHHLRLPLASALILALGASCASLPEEQLGDIPIVDTHIHLYDTTRVQGLPWPPDSDTVLYRPVLPEHFNEVAKKNKLTATVIVEASKWVPDNQWILDLTANQKDIYIGLVGSLEIGEPGFDADLKQFSDDPRYVGLRLRERPRDAEFFNDAVWEDLQLLADMNQCLDVLMFQFSLADVDMIAKRIPNLKILINHVAGVDIDGSAPPAEWVRDIIKVADNPNVHCKISGLFQQSHLQPSPVNVDFYRPVLDVLWDAFGDNRLIYGSNWPVTMRGGNYSDYKKVIMDYFSPKGRKTLEKLLYKNALSFYGLPDLD